MTTLSPEGAPLAALGLRRVTTSSMTTSRRWTMRMTFSVTEEMMMTLSRHRTCCYILFVWLSRSLRLCATSLIWCQARPLLIVNSCRAERTLDDEELDSGDDMGREDRVKSTAAEEFEAMELQIAEASLPRHAVPEPSDNEVGVDLRPACAAC